MQVPDLVPATSYGAGQAPCQCTYALIHSRHPAWLAASVSDHDLHRRDEVASTAQWAGRLNGHAEQNLEEKVISPSTSVRLLAWTTAAIHQVCQVTGFLTAQVLRICDAGSSVVPLNSRVGPKSDRARVSLFRTRATPLFYYLILWSHLISVGSVSVDVRVDVDPTRTSETDMAKHVGYREALQPVSTYDLPRTAKRSYRRAYARSCRQGGAFYKGIAQLVQTSAHHIQNSRTSYQAPGSAESTANADLECGRPTCISLPRTSNVRHRCLP